MPLPLLKSVARAVLWPIRRFLDPRFMAVRSQVIESDHRLHHKIDAVAETIAAQVHAWVRQSTDELVERADAVALAVDEQTAVLREEITRMAERISAALVERADAVPLAVDEQMAVLREEITRMAERISAALAAGQLTNAMPEDVSSLSPEIARLLNFAESHLGFRAQKGLWFNPPVSVEYREGTVTVAAVNERIAEVPYVFRALHGLPPASRVLDVGSAESTVALSLASLGFTVTALDTRPYPLVHPLLRSVPQPLEDWEGDGEPYDAVVCLSSIEHFGLRAYGQESASRDADLTALRKLRGMVREGGRLVLTVPYGVARVEQEQRIYDRDGLLRLVRGWEVADLTIVEQRDDVTWAVMDPGAVASPERRYTALVTATAGGARAA
jgi:hypothetical protein